MKLKALHEALMADSWFYTIANPFLMAEGDQELDGILIDQAVDCWDNRIILSLG